MTFTDEAEEAEEDDVVTHESTSEGATLLSREYAIQSPIPAKTARKVAPVRAQKSITPAQNNSVSSITVRTTRPMKKEVAAKKRKPTSGSAENTVKHPRVRVSNGYAAKARWIKGRR